MRNTPAEKQRHSGVELLRIFAIMMIVAGHYLSKGILNNMPFGSFNTIAARAIEAVAVVGVNCFLLITGYFSVTGKGIHLRRLFDMLLMVAFFDAISYIYYTVCGEHPFSFVDFLKSLAPYLFGGFWFIRVYLILMLVAPFLRIVLLHLSKRAYTSLVLLCLFVFSLFPSFLPAFKNDNGFDILHFAVMYTIGGYLRLHCKRLPPVWISLGLFFFFAIGTCAFSIYGDGLGYWAYDFITVLVSSCFLFIAFLSFQFHSRAINFVARSTLAVFVLENNIHGLYESVLRVKDYMESRMFLPHFVVCVIGFTAIALTVDCLRRLLFQVSIDRLLDRVRPLNVRIFSDLERPTSF